jgi:TRAP-type C4-dicarboxylate transport system permease small subunit
MKSVVAGLRWLDWNLEKIVLVTAYSTCTLIIAVEVFRRYVLSQQAPWSTTIPSYMFLWLTWLGAAYCVKIRAHLCFNEIRDRMPRTWQYVLMQVDYVLFVVFGLVVIYWSGDLVLLQFNIESIVPGTDDLPSWLFYSATPIGWSLLIFRVAQNVIEDARDFRSGGPLKARGTFGSLDSAR